MDSTPEIVIVVPLFNEEENVLPLADEIEHVMATVPRSYQLVFVDDASTDSTRERISEAMRRGNRVRGLRHERNAGQSAALWTGIQATRSPVIVTLDGDRQNDPADLPQLLAALDDCDFVCGVRCNRQDEQAVVKAVPYDPIEHCVGSVQRICAISGAPCTTTRLSAPRPCVTTTVAASSDLYCTGWGM